MSDEKTAGEVRRGQEEKKSPHPMRPPENKSPVRVIYLGATLIEDDGKFLIKNGAIYSNGLPPEIEARVKEDKEFAKLFVPVGSVVVAMKKLRNSDSELSLAYNNVKKSSLARRAKKGR